MILKVYDTDRRPSDRQASSSSLSIPNISKFANWDLGGQVSKNLGFSDRLADNYEYIPKTDTFSHWLEYRYLVILSQCTDNKINIKICTYYNINYYKLMFMRRLYTWPTLVPRERKNNSSPLAHLNLEGLASPYRKKKIGSCHE